MIHRQYIARLLIFYGYINECQRTIRRISNNTARWSYGKVVELIRGVFQTQENSPDEEELEDLEEQLKERVRERQRLGRGRGANRKDRQMVDSVAQEKGMNKEQRQRFGDYIEDIKRQEGRGGADNFTRDELLDLADEFLSS